MSDLIKKVHSMLDWKMSDVGGWYFHKDSIAKVLTSKEGSPPEGAVVRVLTVSEDFEVVTAVPEDGGESFIFARSALVPNLDWGNVPDSFQMFEDSDTVETEPSAFFVNVFGFLKETGKSRISGIPIWRRANRVWGWFPNFPKAFRIVDGNVTDIQECYYEYAMIEQVPPGMSPLKTREWWWKWSTTDDRWIKSSRPADYAQVVGLSVG